MSRPTSGGLSPEEARRLLAQAAQTETTAKAGASWPHIAGLLTLGAASSITLPAMAFAPSGMIAIPISLLMLWIALSFTVMTVFNRGAKRGFGKRWVITIILWGIAWMVSVIGALNWFADQTWFLVAACAALTAITVAGAWVEATR